jgi:hypothetical protein
VPRIRSIKPEFFTSEVITSLPLSARLTFIGLWTYVDDNGVGPDNERLILAAIYPLEGDPSETLRRVSDDLRTLSAAGLVQRYEGDSKRLLYIRSWDEHQRVSHPGKPRYARPLTCENTDPPAILPKSSGKAPETLRPEQGAGSREQGTSTLPPVAASFDEFWAVYPRRIGKEDARKAYAKALKTSAPDVILAGARRYAREVAETEPKFIKHPGPWLRAGRWEDEPTPLLPVVEDEEPWWMRRGGSA